MNKVKVSKHTMEWNTWNTGISSSSKFLNDE